jgi:bifunctional DNA-binding transcriptional regulator/antitoxin component of YhaV-PrlF toxin-antitoxin module
MSLLARSRVWHNVRTAMPKEVRAVLGISDGDEIERVFEGGRVIFRNSKGG